MPRNGDKKCIWNMEAPSIAPERADDAGRLVCGRVGTLELGHRLCLCFGFQYRDRPAISTVLSIVVVLRPVPRLLSAEVSYCRQAWQGPRRTAAVVPAGNPIQVTA